jgi:hypothetical protein
VRPSTKESNRDPILSEMGVVLLAMETRTPGVVKNQIQHMIDLIHDLVDIRPCEFENGICWTHDDQADLRDGPGDGYCPHQHANEFLDTWRLNDVKAEKEVVTKLAEKEVAL